MQYRAVIFDLDGTLLNTLDDLYLSVNYALEHYKYPLRTKEEVKNFVGNGIRDLMTKACPKGIDNFEECLGLFKEHYSRHSRDNTMPYEGVVDLLEQLNQSGIKCAIVSNKFDGAVKELAEKYFKGLIAVAVGESPDVNKKPAPDSIFAVLKTLGLKSGDAIFVGDSDTDVLTAKNAGMKCISVLWGFRSKEFLIKNGATAFVEKPLEILEHIK